MTTSPFSDLEKLEAIMLGQAERLAEAEDRIEVLEELLVRKGEAIKQLEDAFTKVSVFFADIISGEVVIQVSADGVFDEALEELLVQGKDKLN